MSKSALSDSIYMSPYANPYFYKSINYTLLKSKKNNKSQTQLEEDIKNSPNRSSHQIKLTSDQANIEVNHNISQVNVSSPYHNSYFYKSI